MAGPEARSALGACVLCWPWSTEGEGANLDSSGVDSRQRTELERRVEERRDPQREMLKPQPVGFDVTVRRRGRHIPAFFLWKPRNKSRSWGGPCRWTDLLIVTSKIAELDSR